MTASRPIRAPLLKRVATRAPAAIGLLLFVGAAFVVQHTFRHLHLRDVAAAIAATPPRALAIAAGWTLAAYFVLTFYDRLATRYAGHRLSWRRTAFASFCAYVLSHNLGFSAVSGAAVRYRLYAAWGLKPAEIARVIAFCSMTFILGGTAMVGAVALFAPTAVPLGGDAVPPLAIRALGLALWVVIAAYATLARRMPVVCLLRHEIALPSPGTAIRQVTLAVIDVGATAAIAYALMPAAPGLTYPRFVTIYLVSYTAGLLANVPGGLGVFETALLLGLGPYLPPPAILGAAVLFRLYYYIVPLFLAGVMFATHELYLRGVSVLAVLRPIPLRPSGVVRASEADFSVAVSTGLVVLCGAALLAAGAIAPVVAHPMAVVGLPFFSHAGAYAVSLLGAALVVLAVGLAHRVTLAWGSSILLLLLAAPLCVAEQQPLWLSGAAVLAALLMLPYRHAYYRHARLLSEPFHPRTAAPPAAARRLRAGARPAGARFLLSRGELLVAGRAQQHPARAAARLPAGPRAAAAGHDLGADPARPRGLGRLGRRVPPPLLCLRHGAARRRRRRRARRDRAQLHRVPPRGCDHAGGDRRPGRPHARPDLGDLAPARPGAAGRAQHRGVARRARAAGCLARYRAHRLGARRRWPAGRARGGRVSGGRILSLLSGRGGFERDAGGSA